MTDNDKPLHFLQQRIADDIASGVVLRPVTRFPPEPNGYLHIGHAKSIYLNFGLASQFDGVCHLRFDDTNPASEEAQFVRSIEEDVRWLGVAWVGEVRFASDYFATLYQWAQHLVRAGKAYVCDLDAESMREYRGTLTEPGRNSPGRDRPVAENLELLEQMRCGAMDEGAATLRARIDMASPNLNLRDPVLYRIKKAAHHRTGTAWSIYPSYDFAHGQEDAIEGITHSICTLEFESHRPLYEWLIDNLPVPAKPRQVEFARLNLSYTVTSKRKLKQLVDQGAVAGWDDPRMPTIAGLRRRGYSASAIRQFCEMIGVTRSDGVVDVSMLEFAIRSDLNDNAPRAMCVLNPLKLVITNFSADDVATLSAPVHPNRPPMGSRELPFTRELYIDRADFSEDSSLSRKKFKRLVLGEWVRLRSAWIIRADDVVKNDAGELLEVRASLVENTIGASAPEGIKPRGVIHWVSASHGRRATVRLYDRLFEDENPGEGADDVMAHVNPHSLTVQSDCWVEPSLADAEPEQAFQFEREGYFVADRYEHRPEHPVFNMTIGLKENAKK
jgi:glutaminyl-tRNA synthetase